MKKSLLTASLILLAIVFSNLAKADTAIVTETRNWQRVPVTVDATAGTYTVSGTVPNGDYYYSYPGYRCVRVKREMGVDAVIFKASVPGGSEIYCYPE